jgi:hypothetical protein
MADAATLKLRYPALVGVADATINYWLADADRIVTAGWGADADPARLAYAAHHAALTAPAGASSSIPAGVTSFRSGSFSVSVSEAAASRAAEGGYDATSYGQEFKTLLRRHVGGMRLL